MALDVSGAFPNIAYRPKMLRMGGGGASLRIARQRMSFNSLSSFSSAYSKFKCAERAAAAVEAGFFSTREMRGFAAAYGARLGWV